MLNNPNETFEIRYKSFRERILGYGAFIRMLQPGGEKREIGQNYSSLFDIFNQLNKLPYNQRSGKLKLLEERFEEEVVLKVAKLVGRQNTARSSSF